MKTSSVWLVAVRDESFRDFFLLQEWCGPEPFFRPWVGIRWRAGTAFREFRHWIPPAEQPGHTDDVFKKSASGIQSAPRLPISAALKFGALRFLNP